MRALRSLWRARGGATAVEAAFVLPLALLLILGMMEVGRFAWTQSALNFAVQEAARCAVVRPALCADTPTTAAFAVQRASPLKVPAAAFALSHPACGTEVTADVRYQFLVRAIFPAAPTLHAQACRA
jgi:Flp pilus assembly protein TadG